MKGDRTMKDKEMASRMKGTGSQRKVVSNGVDKFTCCLDAEYRSTMRCPMCHGSITVGTLDSHLRGHMAGEEKQQKSAA